MQTVSTSVDISTVYRALELLQELDSVRVWMPVKTSGAMSSSAFVATPLHLVCQACGQVIGAYMKTAQAFAECLQAEYSFQAALERLSDSGALPDPRRYRWQEQVAACRAARWESEGEV